MGNRMTKRGYEYGYQMEVTAGRSGPMPVNPAIGPLERYALPFENIAFQSCGALCLSYIGCVRMLEDAGCWKQIRRMAGSGAGALVAALLCVGLISSQLERYLRRGLSRHFKSSFCPCVGCFGTRSMGWDTGKKGYDWLGRRLREITQNPDITFAQVLDRYGKELCIVTTNVSQRTVEYCHPKTTPDMPIRLAVRMSMADPVLFDPVQNPNGLNIYSAGSPLYTYPIHCFDGWFLSMRPDDSFVRRLHPIHDIARLQDRCEGFNKFNEGTIGFLPYSEWGLTSMQTMLEHKEGAQRPTVISQTKLARERLCVMEAKAFACKKYDEVVSSANKLLKAIKTRLVREGKNSLSRAELHHTLSTNTDFTANDLRIVMGDTASANDLLNALTPNDLSQVMYGDVVLFLDRYRAMYQARVTKLNRQIIRTKRDFAENLRDTVYQNTTHLNTYRKDLDRTVGINTYYLRVRDWVLDFDDINLLIEQGRSATYNFLVYHISRRHPPLKGEAGQSYFNDQIKHYMDDDLTDMIDERDYMESLDRYV